MRPGTAPHRGRRSSLARGASAWAVAAGVVLASAGCGEDVLVGRLDAEDDASGGALSDGGAGAPLRDADDGRGPDDACVLEGGCGASDGGPAPSPECSGKVCGERCTTCPAGSICPAVIEACDAFGRCLPGSPVCSPEDAGPAYVPCGGKLCGDPCTLCRPGDVTCAETAVPKFCQPDLRSCRSEVPPCGG